MAKLLIGWCGSGEGGGAKPPLMKHLGGEVEEEVVWGAKLLGTNPADKV